MLLAGSMASACSSSDAARDTAQALDGTRDAGATDARDDRVASGNRLPEAGASDAGAGDEGAAVTDAGAGGPDATDDGAEEDAAGEAGDPLAREANDAGATEADAAVDDAAAEATLEGGEPDAEIDDAASEAAARSGADAAGYVGPTFTNVATAAGLTFVQQPLTWGVQCAPDDPTCDLTQRMQTGGIAVGDYDGDGAPDLYATRLRGPGVLLRNRGDGTFEDVTAAAGVDGVGDTAGAVFADLDRDGDQDLYVTSMEGMAHHLFVNDGAGHLTDEATARGAAIDPGTLRFGTGVAAGDYDGDGWLDLYAAEWHILPKTDAGAWPSHNRLLHNRGAAGPGTFDDVTAAAGVDLARPYKSPDGIAGFTPGFVDFDGDGAMDLLISGDFETSRLFWGDGAGGFVDGTSALAPVTGYGMGATIGDFDRDGNLDWFVTSIAVTGVYPDDGNHLYRGLGGRSIAEGAVAAGVSDAGWAWGAGAFDYDNDGDLDLVVGNGAQYQGSRWLDSRVVLWRNAGDGTFEPVGSEAGMTEQSQGRGVSIVDYDDDGDLDVVVARSADTPLLYRNDGGNQNDWLRVVLVSRASAPDGIGARVELVDRAGATPQLRAVQRGNGYLGCSEPEVHFGLGAPSSDPVYELRVRWPATGQVQVLHDLPRRSTIVVSEP